MDAIGGGSTSSTDNLSSIPKTEVEVFQFREVEASPVKPSKDVGAQVELCFQQVTKELELDNLSDRSSACDCPAHVHDKEFPLEISKGHEKAFDGLSQEEGALIWRVENWEETGTQDKKVNDEILDHNSDLKTGAPKLIIESATPEVGSPEPAFLYQQSSETETPKLDSEIGTPTHKRTPTHKSKRNTHNTKSKSEDIESQGFDPWETSETPLYCSQMRGESRVNETDVDIWPPQWKRGEVYGRETSEVLPPLMYRVETPEIGTDEMGRPLYFPPNYSYGCLMKKWSL